MLKIIQGGGNIAQVLINNARHEKTPGEFDTKIWDITMTFKLSYFIYIYYNISKVEKLMGSLANPLLSSLLYKLPVKKVIKINLNYTMPRFYKSFGKCAADFGFLDIVDISISQLNV